MQNRPRILLLTSSYPAWVEDGRAAAGVFVRHFARELGKLADVTVLTQKKEQGTAVLHDSGCEVVRFPWTGGNRPLSTLIFPRDAMAILSVMVGGLWKALIVRRKKRIDFVLAFWAIPSGLWALFLKVFSGTPYDVWCLGSDIWACERKPLRRIIVRIILSRAANVYADGYQLKRDAEVLSGRVCHFLPTTRRLPVGKAEAVNIYKGERNYLFIGRYHPNKGPDVLLEAISRLDEKIKQRAHFHFFGGGPLEKEMKAFAKAHGIEQSISINGYIDETHAAAFLRACDGLIIPSRIESIPVVLSDALQTGCPIIATDVGDMGTLLRKEHAGRVVVPESPDALALAIGEDISEKQDFARGRERLAEIFDLSKSVKKFVSGHFDDYARS